MTNVNENNWCSRESQSKVHFSHRVFRLLGLDHLFFNLRGVGGGGELGV